MALRTLELRQAVRDVEHAQTKLVVQAEREQSRLEESRHELFQFLEKMPMGVFVIDAQGTPVYASEQAKEILGKGIMPGESEGRLAEVYAVYRRGTDDIYPEAELPIMRALSGEVCSADDFEIRRPDKTIPLSARAAPVRHDDGSVAYALVAFEDITEKVRAETERLQGQKLESVGQLAAGIAHEINTPLQYIGDNAQFLRKAVTNVMAMLDHHEQLLANDNVPDSVREEAAQKARKLKLKFLKKRAPSAIESTIEGVESVSRLVRAMKEFSHPGEGDKEATDINHAIETTLTVSKNEWKYVAEVETDFDPEVKDVPCMPGELNQVILNMVVNSAHAIEHVVGDSGEKGTIRLQTRLVGYEAEIQISDTGSGIPQELVRKIFDPFFTTKGVGKGTGQGLAIARSIIVDKHGGSISVDSEPGAGTTFTIRLPMTELGDEASHSEEQGAA